MAQEMRKAGQPGTMGRSLAASLILAFSALTAPLARSQNTAQLPSAPMPTATTPTAGSTSPAATTQGSTGGGFPVQLSTQSSLFNPYLGSIQVVPAVPHDLSLTLDDALRMGLANNLGLVYATQNEVTNRAQRLTDLAILLPRIDVSGGTALHQYNLAAQGFRAGLLPQFTRALPPGSPQIVFRPIVKVDVTQGQANFSQYLFNLAGLDLVHALAHLVKSSQRSAADSRGQVVQAVGIAYLRVLAAQSQVEYDQSLLQTDEKVLYQSTQEHQAGIIPNLDELRSRVQYQTEQQALIADQGTLAKAKIALNRTIGLAPEQQIRLAEAAPFPQLQPMPAEEAEREALAQRQDYQSAIEQLRAAELARKAAVRERLPTLLFTADYGVQGVSGLIFHDIWNATGTLQIPVFQEAKFRSDRDSAEFQLENARGSVGNVGGQIRQQVRDSLIDLKAATDSLVVAQSNAALSQIALDQSIERFRAGVDDNLPAIEAGSTLAQAQVQLVNATFQFNQTKLNFARNLGLIDVDFHPEWQSGHPAALLSDRAAEGR